MGVIRIVLIVVRGVFRDRAELAAENLALRVQLAVMRQPAPSSCIALAMLLTANACNTQLMLADSAMYEGDYATACSISLPPVGEPTVRQPSASTTSP